MTCCGKGRPLTTLRRYSGIWSTVSGVPCARRRTAALAMSGLFETEFADHFNDGLDVFDRGVGHDAVAQIEDVARATGGGSQNRLDASFEDLEGCKECDGVKVALDGVAMAYRAPALVERLTPVEADDIGTGRSHGAEQAC